jgi:hypothetical protein
MSARHQRLGAVELLLRECQLTLLLCHIGASLVECTLRAQHLSFGFFQRRLEISCVHTRDNLSCFHYIALISEEFCDAAGELRGDVDLVSFEPAIA